MNTFYTDFDYQAMEPGSLPGYRTPFQRDRDRIIHSSAFRRLQAKTQVFLSGEYDFYRTRLTHSMEVAQIGRSICHYLMQADEKLSDDFFIDADLVEAICLSHDIGHPPFGHAGERTLNRLMKHYGGFEGNAQTLRMLTDIIYSGGGQRKGMNPSRAFLDGVLKYKTLFSEFEDPENHFLYDEQAAVLDFVFDNRQYKDLLTPGKKRNAFRSIECQIMDWADDTAYSLNDVVDGINAGFITREKLEHWGRKKQLDKTEAGYLETVLQAIYTDDVEHTFARKIGQFINGCRLKERDNFMSGQTNRYRFELEVDNAVRQEAGFYSQLSVEMVFRSPQLHQLEYKSDFMLEKIFSAFRQNYLSNGEKGFRILPVATDRLIQQQENPAKKARIICDQLAGMTDGFATRTYKRLFDPDFGSIVDLI